MVAQRKESLSSSIITVLILTAIVLLLSWFVLKTPSVSHPSSRQVLACPVTGPANFLFRDNLID